MRDDLPHPVGTCEDCDRYRAARYLASLKRQPVKPVDTEGGKQYH
jgi:hypothetical protein